MVLVACAVGAVRLRGGCWGVVWMLAWAGGLGAGCAVLLLASAVGAVGLLRGYWGCCAGPIYCCGGCGPAAGVVLVGRRSVMEDLGLVRGCLWRVCLFL